MTIIESFIAEHGAWSLAGAGIVLFLGGLVKGAVGFALPLIAVSGISMFLPAQTAVALMMVSMLTANLWQSFRDGVGAATETIGRYRVLLLVLLPTILAFSQFLAVVPERLFFAILGGGVTLFSILQLIGWRPVFVTRAPLLSQAGAGLIGGLFGGLAGIWGPPVTLYLVAASTSKRDTMLALGVIFGLGSVVLVAGMIAAGLLNATTGLLSALLAGPAMLGMGLGLWLHDKLNAAAFRRATLVVLVLTGLNLVRRSLTG